MKRFFARLYGRVTRAYTKLFPNTLKKRTWWPIFIVAVLLVVVLSVHSVHAAVGIDDILNWVVGVLARLLLELAKLCIFLAIFFLRAFVTLASYNNFIDVSVVKLGWVMVRDVANMFFIVGLLVIAFATILGFESYEWKHGLVKIVLMAILINFSNLIAQLVIDVAHIFTITFLNAVSATAGGNLITLFQMDKILSMAAGAPEALGQTREVADLTLFAGSVLAFVFALLAALTIGAYLVVMIARIVVLWALIILSPLAFMLYAVPKGEDYAHEWWSEFSKHVIVAPVMVFFLWLAFATLGTGQIMSEIQKDPNVIQINASGEATTDQSVTILEISTWENFASFLLGIAFLWVGIKKTEESGATGSHLVGSAIDFTKNVATIATGYAAGRWLVGGTVDKAKDLGSGAMHATGEYARLGYNKVLDKNPRLGKVIRAPGKFFKKGKIAREKAIEQLEKREHDWEHEQHAKADLWLAPSKESRAHQEIAAHEAEREEKAKYTTVEAKIKLEELKHKEHEYEEAYDHLIKEEEKKVRKPLTDDEKKTLFENKDEVAKKIIKDEEEKRRDEYMIRNADEIAKAIEAAQKAKGGDGKLTEEERDKVVEAKRKEIKLEDAEKAAIVERVSKKELVLNDKQKEQLLEEKIAKRASEAISEKRRAALRREAAEHVGGEIETIALENEAARPANKYVIEQQRVKAGIVDEQRIQEGKKRKAVRVYQVKEAQEDLEDYKDYLYDEHMEELVANFKNIQEIGEKKKRKEELTKDEKEIYKNAVQAQGRNLSSMYSKNYAKFLRDKLVEIDPSYANVNFTDPRYRHILNLALMSGKSLKDFTVDGSFDVTDEKKGDKVRQKHAQIASSVGADLKDKKGTILRGLMVASDKAAYEHNNIEATHQFSVGKDRHGDEVVMPTAVMGRGQFATGEDLYVTGDGRKGHERIRDKLDFSMSGKTIDKIDSGSIGDGGPTIGARVEDSKKESKSIQLLQKFASKAIVELIKTIGNKSASEIARMPRELINTIVGGQVDLSSFDNASKKFLAANEDMRHDIGAMFEVFHKSYNTATNAATKDNVKKSIKVFLESAGVQEENIEALVKNIAFSSKDEKRAFDAKQIIDLTATDKKK